MNVETAGEFVKALTGDAGCPCTWQTFADRKEDRDNPEVKAKLTRVYNGPLRQHVRALEALNDERAGVYITVNETDLRGRQEKNVIGLRALFVDCDTGDLPALPLPPSIVVQSGHGQHAYWLLEPGEPLERFRDAQAKLAEALGTDPSVKDLPRVMRLPGSTHHKGEPFAVRLLETHPERRYRIADVLAALPAPEPAPRAPVAQRAVVNGHPGSDAMTRARAYMARVPGAVEGEHGDDATFRAACVVVNDFGLSESEARDVLAEWNATCSPPWADEELDAKIRNAQRYAKRPAGEKLDSPRPPRLSVVPDPPADDVPHTVETIAKPPAPFTAEREPGSDDGGVPAHRPIVPDPLPGGTLLDAVFPPEQFAITPIVPLADLTDWNGKHGIMKSTIALGACLSVATGRDFGGLEVMQGRAVFVTLEDSMRRLHGRLFGWLHGIKNLEHRQEAERAIRENFSFLSIDQLDDLVLVGTKFGEPIRNEPAIERLAQLFSGAKIAVLDTASCLLNGNENDNNTQSKFAGACQAIARRSGAGVIVVRHVSKAMAAANASGSYAGRGAGSFADKARSVIGFTRPGQDDDDEGEEDDKLSTVLMKQGKHTDRAHGISITWQPVKTPAGSVYVEALEGTSLVREHAEKLLWLPPPDGISWNKLFKMTPEERGGVPKSKLRNAVDYLLDTDQWRQQEVEYKGNKGIKYFKTGGIG